MLAEFGDHTPADAIDPAKFAAWFTGQLGAASALDLERGPQRVQVGGRVLAAAGLGQR